VVAVPDAKDVLEKLAVVEKRLADDIGSRLELAELRLETICASAAFRNPILQVRNRQQQLDDVGGDLEELIEEMITDARKRLNGYYEQVVRLEPRRLLGVRTIEVNELRSRANAAVSALLGRARMQLTAQENRLEGLNPRAVLKRGYSITTLKQTGAVLKNAAQVQIGDTLVTELAENLIESRVVKK
jgi:exodeoxyribonuclease VII large subunit